MVTAIAAVTAITTMEVIILDNGAHSFWIYHYAGSSNNNSSTSTSTRWILSTRKFSFGENERAERCLVFFRFQCAVKAGKCQPFS
mmetsp:Transcript_1882/g.2735  ORF Transcript_1882/g.2735 Transcript_1882/m.2735 type:complete len:85 (+) Transcript_1882:1024-1278(+)